MGCRGGRGSGILLEIGRNTGVVTGAFSKGLSLSEGVSCARRQGGVPLTDGAAEVMVAKKRRPSKDAVTALAVIMYMKNVLRYRGA